ncbi:MAG: hypothetical protein AB1Z98_29200, partial [Nannocystaceae bacterium]
REDGGVVVVVGESVRRDRRGEPWVRTRAVLQPGRGPTRLEVHTGRRSRVVQRTRSEEPS